MALWEKDKRVVAMYKECMTNFMEQARSGEDVDWEDACSVEAGKVQSYLNDMIYTYKYMNAKQFSEGRAAMYTPRLPYYQDF
jgi:hypothetical protein